MATDKSQSNTAYTMFGSACYADPTWPDAWYQQGNNNNDLKATHAAVACYRRALECEPEPSLRGRILTNLGWCLHQVGKTQEALSVSLEAVELDASLSPAWINLSCIHGTQRRTATALDCALKAKALAPDDPIAGMSLAFAYLFDRQWAKGFAEFEIRWKYRLHHFLHYPYPEWAGEPDRNVFCVFDQGMGDTLSFARFLPAVAARSRFVQVSIQPELLRWFQHAFLHIKNINLVPGAINFPGDCDCWTTFVSLPYALGLTNQQI